jgi:hypothetical protein
MSKVPLYDSFSGLNEVYGEPNLSNDYSGTSLIRNYQPPRTTIWP